MIDDTLNMSDFLNYIRPKDLPILEELREYAKSNYVPIIKDEMKQLMEVLLLIHQPKKILEIGTAIGYSSIMMSLAMDNYALNEHHIVTVERSIEMYSLAVDNISRVNKEKCITPIFGDAETVLQDFVNKEATFDLIFMDAAKGQYLTFLPHCLDLLRKGGLLISDNVLQGGDIAKSRFSVARRQRTIHQRMREYLWILQHSEDLKTSILSIADGSTISVKMR